MGLATVCVDVAPVYERPSTASLRLDEMLYGMSAQVMQESETGWCYLRTEYQTEGYVPSACLLRDADVAAAWRKYKKTVVLAPYVDVQRQAESDAGRIVSVTRGGTLVPLGSADGEGWQKVGLADGTVGYTRASYLGDVITDWQEITEDDMRWNLVETALSYNGTAWRTGGRSPLGIDAVGLVAMSYLMNGVAIPRAAELQAGVLKAISPKKAEEGDLLFFPGSVGIYMGDDRFVHATATAGGEGVVVNSLRAKDEEYRADMAESIIAAASIF